MPRKVLDIILAKPRGFCAGVERAIEIVERAIAKYGPPIYVKHDIVHNKYVVDNLRERGAIFVEDLEQIPQNSFVIFSAHGVSATVESEATARSLNIIDATCPLVTKVHLEAQKQEKAGRTIVLIGHDAHPEVEGTRGRIQGETILVQTVQDVEKIDLPTNANIAYVTQTTLSVDDTKDIVMALKHKFPNIRGPGVDDICYATQNRQDAIQTLSKQTELILVIGSQNSSNSNRLRDLAEKNGITSYLIDSADNLDLHWFKDISKLGITAGASAPEILLQELLDKLAKYYNISISELNGTEENLKFKLPRELK